MRNRNKRLGPLLGTAVLCLSLGLGLGPGLPGAAAVQPGEEAEPVSGSEQAGERLLVPVGRAVGIRMFSDGVMVVGFSRIPAPEGGCIPARSCGLREGDIITHINAAEVDTIEEVQDQLAAIGGEPMSIRALRKGEEVQMTAQAVRCSTDGSYKLGAWLRDSMAGIGTVTYYDPQTGAFGALGHGINDVDTGQLMPLESGAVLRASVKDVKRGGRGEPGELHGQLDRTADLGILRANTGHGIFGTLTDDRLTEGRQALPVASPSEVTPGPAQILSNVSGTEVRAYDVEILKVMPDSGDGRDLLLEVTDPALLEVTGGIVQGMSGSPIVQNGKLVGAVTHVLVNDPSRGYGILMETMLEAGSRK